LTEGTGPQQPPAAGHVIPIHFPIGKMLIFDDFMKELRTVNRFAISDPARELIDAALRFARRHKEVVLRRGLKVYRARRHDDHVSLEPPKAFDTSEMTAPRPERTGPGRLNPAGIPYLYVAADPETAMAEIKPWAGAFVSLAELTLAGDATVADFCSSERAEAVDPDADAMWNVIGDYFSIPYNPNDPLSYLGTQYVAESLKRAGFHGVRYDGALSRMGQNIAFFDTKAASVVGTVTLFRTKRVEYEFTPNPL